VSDGIWDANRNGIRATIIRLAQPYLMVIKIKDAICSHQKAVAEDIRHKGRSVIRIVGVFIFEVERESAVAGRPNMIIIYCVLE
jgi:hypothetical protein